MRSLFKKIEIFQAYWLHISTVSTSLILARATSQECLFGFRLLSEIPARPIMVIRFHTLVLRSKRTMPVCYTVLFKHFVRSLRLWAKSAREHFPWSLLFWSLWSSPKMQWKKGKITFEKSKLYYKNTTQELLGTVRHFTSTNYCSCVLLPASRRNLRVSIGEFLHINHLLHHFLREVFSTSDALDRFLNNRR